MEIHSHVKSKKKVVIILLNVILFTSISHFLIKKEISKHIFCLNIYRKFKFY